MARAASSRRRRAWPRSPVGEKKTELSIPRHAASACHSHIRRRRLGLCLHRILLPCTCDDGTNGGLWCSPVASKNLDGSRLAVAGDSVGGNMSAALTLMAKERGDIPLVQQVLFYPITDANFDTGSYHQFAEGYFLRRDGMQWFRDQYTTDEADRAQITASPLRATTEQLTGLPPALVITGEADVLRDEGEAYANKLREAGVPVTAVRFQGIIHDFVMLNALRETQAAQAAITLAADTLRTALHTR
ncbi:alpha/beta hydrolase [Streptomyces sp. NBC_01361]|uniref:alpha/beta hydrolase n=1 Tax=Streptomyces sp. NBC_01361 TaxID=2903838 RepID=UPI003FCD2954